MKRLFPTFALVIFLLVSLSFFPKSALEQLETNDSSEINYVAGKIVIQLGEDISPVIPRLENGIIQTGIGPIDVLCYLYKVHSMKRQFPDPKYVLPDLTRHFIVRFDESMNLDEVVDAFSSIPFYIKKAEKVGLHRYDATPNDTWLTRQWYLNNNLGDCDIDALEAWNIQKGSNGVILAVADSGVQYNHPDLSGNIWEGIGWDFYGDGEQEDADPMDSNGHGTHCAGIAAAMTNNQMGIAGIAGGWYQGQQGCKIMCLRIGSSEEVDMSCAAQAIHYATDHGAVAINCSWPSGGTGSLPEAVDYATSHGLLIVHSAGNYNIDDPDYLGGRTDYLNVAATNSADKKASYSNYGSWVDVAAPGGDGSGNGRIYSTWIGSGYAWAKGTSQAAPMVVGLAGLLKSERPSWNRQTIWNAIVQSADYINSPKPIGSGRINAFDALKQIWGAPSAPTNLAAQAVAYNQINLSWTDNVDNETEFYIYRKTEGGTYSKIGTARKNANSYQDTTLQPSTKYYYKIKAHNINGDSSYSNETSATTPGPAPQAPSNLNATGSCWEVGLTWQDNSNNEDGFYIYRKTGDQFIQFDYVGPNVTTYWDIGLFCGELWCYKVSAFNQGGNSPLSNSACDYTELCYLCEGQLSLKIIPDKNAIGPGEMVTYSYKLENKGEVDLTDIILTDDRCGIVAAIPLLKKGDVRIFTKAITLTATMTIFAEAVAVCHVDNKEKRVIAHACATVEVKM